MITFILIIMVIIMVVTINSLMEERDRLLKERDMAIDRLKEEREKNESQKDFTRSIFIELRDEKDVLTRILDDLKRRGICW